MKKIDLKNYMRANKEFIPKCIMDCLTVTISNISTNTESDILIFDIPNSRSFENEEISLEEHFQRNISESTLINLQSKTNWNDNAQIPMLWDLVYNSESRLSHVSVGINGYSPNSFKIFKYAFVTVPTVKKEIKPESIAVARVKNLTGGNFWGKTTKSGVASNIKEIAARFFSIYFSGSVARHLSQLSANSEYPQNFIDLNW